jgi:hypothetical protein
MSDDQDKREEEVPAPSPAPDGNETERWIERVVAERGDEVILYDDNNELLNAYVDTLRELVDAYESSGGQDSEERHSEMLLSFMIAADDEFLDQARERDPRYAPYVDDIATRMKYDAASDDSDKWWPFEIDENSDKTGESDEC